MAWRMAGWRSEGESWIDAGLNIVKAGNGKDVLLGDLGGWILEEFGVKVSS